MAKSFLETIKDDKPLFLCNGCKYGSENIGITVYITIKYITFLVKKQAFFYSSSVSQGGPQ